MKLIDKNNNPITDPSTLPAVEAAVADTTAAVDDASITHGKNGAPELPAIGFDEGANKSGLIAAAALAAGFSSETIKMVPNASDKCGLPAIMGTTSTDEVSDADDKRLCPRDQMVARLRNIKDRLYTYANQSAGRISLVSELLTTAQQLQLAIEMSAALPPDWKPVRSLPTAALAEGVHVFIKSKHWALYQSDLSADDMDDMVVVRAGEKRLRCHCVATGVSIFIPAGHVEVR